MLRTMELIAGLEPMSQYDAAATPMWRCFTDTANVTPFTAIAANVDLTEKNLAWNKLAERSEKFDLSKEDAVPDLEFNEVLWLALKGTPFPGPKRSAFVNLQPHEEEEDD
jgi:hypothetical protein